MATVIGMFESSHDADELVDDLQREGYSRTQIGVVARHGVLQQRGLDFATGAEVGTVTGATAGGIAGLLVGLGALLIPGLDILAAGTFLVVVGATVLGLAGGAIAGGLIGSLMGFGLSEERARRYAEGVKAGHVLVSVVARQDQTDQVEALMRQHNAVEVDIGSGPEGKLTVPATVTAGATMPGAEAQQQPPSVQ